MTAPIGNCLCFPFYLEFLLWMTMHPMLCSVFLVFVFVCIFSIFGYALAFSLVSHSAKLIHVFRTHPRRRADLYSVSFFLGCLSIKPIIYIYKESDFISNNNNMLKKTLKSVNELANHYIHKLMTIWDEKRRNKRTKPNQPKWHDTMSMNMFSFYVVPSFHSVSLCTLCDCRRYFC